MSDTSIVRMYAAAVALGLLGCGAVMAEETLVQAPSGVGPLIELPAISPFSDALNVPPPASLFTSDNESAVPPAYLVEPARLPGDVITAWLANPNSLLESYPDGGPAMWSYVRRLAGSDNRTIVALISLARNPESNGSQLDAIARGLAGATQGAQSIAPLYSLYIQRMVAESASPELIAAFAKWLAEPETSEIDQGVGAPTGGASAGTLTGAGGIGPSGILGTTSSVPSTSGTFAVNGGSVGAVGDGDTGGTDASPTL